MASHERVDWGAAVDAREENLDRVLAEILKDEQASSQVGPPRLRGTPQPMLALQQCKYCQSKVKSSKIEYHVTKVPSRSLEANSSSRRDGHSAHRGTSPKNHPDMVGPKRTLI